MQTVTSKILEIPINMKRYIFKKKISSLIPRGWLLCVEEKNNPISFLSVPTRLLELTLNAISMKMANYCSKGPVRLLD